MTHNEIMELLGISEDDLCPAKVDVPAGCRDNGDRRGPDGEEPAFANNFVHVETGVSIAGPAPSAGNGWHVGDDASGATVLVARTLELAVELAPIVATLASARQFLTPLTPNDKTPAVEAA